MEDPKQFCFNNNKYRVLKNVPKIEFANDEIDLASSMVKAFKLISFRYTNFLFLISLIVHLVRILNYKSFQSQAMELSVQRQINLRGAKTQNHQGIMLTIWLKNRYNWYG